MSAARLEHEMFCPAVRLAGLTEPRIEAYLIDRLDDSGKKAGAVHCTRCVECGVIRYMDLM